MTDPTVNILPPGQVPPEPGPALRVLLVGLSASFVSVVSEALTGLGGFATESCARVSHALNLAHSFQPTVILFGLSTQGVVEDWEGFRLLRADAATREVPRLELPEELKSGLAVARDNEMHDPVFPNGTAICEVEIDPDTCEMKVVRYSTIDDVGRCINPMIVHGQTHGGIVQGLGQAIFEHCTLDPSSGQLLAGSFMDYGMPRASDMPSFRAEIAEVLSPTNPLGIKAGGEGGTTPALSTLVSAVVDALKPYGVTHIDMPVTPLAIFRAIRQSKSQGVHS